MALLMYILSALVLFTLIPAFMRDYNNLPASYKDTLTYFKVLHPRFTLLALLTVPLAVVIESHEFSFSIVSVFIWILAGFILSHHHVTKITCFSIAFIFMAFTSAWYLLILIFYLVIIVYLGRKLISIEYSIDLYPPKVKAYNILSEFLILVIYFIFLA